MKILIGIWHPAHVHFFKNYIWEMEKRGHEIKVVVLEKEIDRQLLDLYKIKYQTLGRNPPGMINKVKNVLLLDKKIYDLTSEFRPDLMMGIAAIFFAHVGKIRGIPSIIFTDSELSTLINRITFPFADVISTPSCYMRKVDPKKHVTFEGYKELAYLHPNRFTPDPAVLNELGIMPGERYMILRFISWGASHDLDLKGMKQDEEEAFVKGLEKYGRVLITSERKLAPALEKYRITCSPEKMHSLLNYASLYIGEGGTMATEAAVLGIPSIHIESNSKGIATGNFYGNFMELRKYGLLYFYPNQEEALKKAIDILENKDSKKEWLAKREKLLKDKVDVTSWMIDYTENYCKKKKR
jgi:predicted glycosyltransferase